MNKEPIVISKGETKLMFFPTQDPYLAGTHEEPYFEAHGKDITGDEMIVRWKITHPDFKNLEDESEACDWEKFSEIEYRR